jgi:hypothetical protein
MLMNGITPKDLTNVLMTVTVMVKEPVLTDGVLVMLDLITTDVPVSQLTPPMLSMITPMTKIVTMLLSILNVTIKEKSSKLLMKFPVSIGNQNPSVYQEEKPSELMIYVTSLVKKLCSLLLSLVSMISNSKC